MARFNWTKIVLNFDHILIKYFVKYKRKMPRGVNIILVEF